MVVFQILLRLAEGLGDFSEVKADYGRLKDSRDVIRNKVAFVATPSRHLTKMFRSIVSWLWSTTLSAQDWNERPCSGMESKQAMLNIEHKRLWNAMVS